MSKRTGWLKGLFALLTVVVAVTGPVVSGYAQTATPIVVVIPSAPQWTGRIVSIVQDLSLRGSVLRVSVNGLKGLPVKVSSAGGTWSVIGLTGTKPEFGPYMVEFAALSRGSYVIEPQGLGTSLPFYSDTTSYITVEFSKEAVATLAPAVSPIPSSTRSPVVPAPTVIVLPTWTPVPVMPTSTATALPPTPTPSPTVILPTVPPTVSATETPTPQTITVWSGRVNYSRLAQWSVFSAIAVRVPGQEGLTVNVKSDAFETTAVTGTKPEYGRFACEVGGLGPGTYTVSPQGIDSSVTVTLEPGTFALVEFTPMVLALTPVPLAMASITPPLAATPRVWPTRPAAPIPMRTEVPIAVPSEVPPTETVSVVATVSSTITGTVASPFSVLPPLPKPAWSAQVSERIPGTESKRLAVTLVVRVLGAKGLGVTLDSGGWQSHATTGSKAEYGDFACEFGGLPAGDYEIAPDGLNLRYKVNAKMGDFVVVDFIYRAPVVPTVPVMVAEAGTPFSLSAPTVTSTLSVPSLTSAPSAPSLPSATWTGRVVSQTVAAEGVEPSGNIIVQVKGLDGLPVEVKSAQGWSAFARTEAREGYEGFVVEFVRLAPGQYQVIPQGLKTWVELNLSKGSRTWLEFASQ